MTARLHDTFPLSNWAAMDRFLVRCYGERYVLRDQALMRWQYGLTPRISAFSGTGPKTR